MILTEIPYATDKEGWIKMADQNKPHANPVQVQKFLGGINYPCSKQDILKTAKSHGADENVLKLLQELPDQHYNKPTDVTKAIGKLE